MRDPTNPFTNISLITDGTNATPYPHKQAILKSAFRVYDIIPVAKPRMTRRDKWQNRPAVARYRAFKDECRLKKLELPESGYHVIFVMPMPKSWTKKMQTEMDGRPHTVKPDKDNLEKALLDALYKDDSAVWDGRVTKIWGYSGAIKVGLI